MNLKMHLHLNSELASNDIFTEFSFKIRMIPSGFALVRQRTGHERQDTCKYERGRARVAPAPFNYEMASSRPPPPPPSHTHKHTTTTPVFPSSPVSSTVCGVFVTLHCLCVCALIRPRIRNKILASCIFIQLRLDQQGTNLC